MAENENIINEAMPVEEKAVEETPVMEAPVKKAPKAPKQKPVPAEDFDWTSSHKKFDNYSADDLATFVGLVDAVPRLEQLSLLVREDELAVGTFLVLNVDFNLVAHLQVGVGTEFSNRDNTIRLEADVDHDLAVSDGHHGAFDDLMVGDLVHCACILLFEFSTFVI